MKWRISGQNYQFNVNNTRDAIAALLEMDDNAIATAHKSKTSLENVFFLEVGKFSWGTQILIHSKMPFFEGQAVGIMENKCVAITIGNPAENLLTEVRKAIKKF